MRHCCFECCQARRRKLRGGSQLFHRPVAAACRDKRCRSCPAFKSKLQRSNSPLESFVFSHEGRFDQNKGTQVDLVLLQKLCSGCELSNGHALIQLLKYFGVHCLQTHCDFKLSRDQVSESNTRVRHQCWMTFDDDPFKGGNASCDCRVILCWDGSRIEEASAVVELNLTRQSKTLKCIVNLRRNGSYRNRLHERIP